MVGTGEVLNVFYGISSFVSDTIITGRLCSICLDSSGIVHKAEYSTN